MQCPVLGHTTIMTLLLELRVSIRAKLFALSVYSYRGNGKLVLLMCQRLQDQDWFRISYNLKALRNQWLESTSKLYYSKKEDVRRNSWFTHTRCFVFNLNTYISGRKTLKSIRDCRKWNLIITYSISCNKLQEQKERCLTE